MTTIYGHSGIPFRISSSLHNYVDLKGSRFWGVPYNQLKSFIDLQQICFLRKKKGNYIRKLYLSNAARSYSVGKVLLISWSGEECKSATFLNGATEVPKNDIVGQAQKFTEPRTTPNSLKSANARSAQCRNLIQSRSNWRVRSLHYWKLMKRSHEKVVLNLLGMILAYLAFSGSFAAPAVAHVTKPSSHVSVERVLAEQLARRFRDMSDEELVDMIEQILSARSTLQAPPFPERSPVVSERNYTNSDFASLPQEPKTATEGEIADSRKGLQEEPVESDGEQESTVAETSKIVLKNKSIPETSRDPQMPNRDLTSELWQGLTLEESKDSSGVREKEAKLEENTLTASGFPGMPSEFSEKFASEEKEDFVQETTSLVRILLGAAFVLPAMVLLYRRIAVSGGKEPVEKGEDMDAGSGSAIPPSPAPRQKKTEELNQENEAEEEEGRKIPNASVPEESTGPPSSFLESSDANGNGVVQVSPSRPLLQSNPGSVLWTRTVPSQPPTQQRLTPKSDVNPVETNESPKKSFEKRSRLRERRIFLDDEELWWDPGPPSTTLPEESSNTGVDYEVSHKYLNKGLKYRSRVDTRAVDFLEQNPDLDRVSQLKSRISMNYEASSPSQNGSASYSAENPRNRTGNGAIYKEISQNGAAKMGSSQNEALKVPGNGAMHHSSHVGALKNEEEDSKSHLEAGRRSERTGRIGVSKPRLDWFQHKGLLWVRGTDGVFSSMTTKQKQ